MKPSVGRIVHYYNLQGAGPFAAIITEVKPLTEIVGLTAFCPADAVGAFMQFAIGNVERSDEPEPGKWMWPPRV